MPRIGAARLESRRAEILDGARATFGRLGYEGATVRALEEATGLSRGAIFHHFRDKEALFLAVAVRDADEMAATIADQGLVAVLRGMIADGRPGWVGTQLEVSRRVRTDPAFREVWRPHAARMASAVRSRLRRQRAAGVVRSDVDIDGLAAYLELVQEGLVAHLAAGLPADRLDAVLDLVEGSVRR